MKTQVLSLAGAIAMPKVAKKLQDKYKYVPSKSPINPNAWETLNDKLLDYNSIDVLKKSGMKFINNLKM